MALGMALNGAAGETLEAMRETLEFSGMTEDEINKSYRNLIDFLGSLDPKVKLEIANSIWARLGFAIEQTFLDINRSFFDAEVRQLDFGDPSTVDTINAWVNEKTHGKIESIIESISRETVMYLINAVYFNAEWTTPFDTLSTERAFFLTIDNTYVPCWMMATRMDIPHFFSDQLKAVELPYGDGEFSMVIVLPNDGVEFADFVAQLDDDAWNSLLDSMNSSRVFVQIPRFGFEFDKTLNENLSALGMGIAFDDRQADFSRINRIFQLYISEVKHKTFIRVGELGTEAAAVASVGFNIIYSPYNEFLANRPFLFAIRERQSGSILFIGQVTDPGFE
jgi:serpin B